MEERMINSIQELIAALEEDLSDYSGSYWYRGQGNAEWTLIPGYYRLEEAPSESTLLKKFKQSAAMLTSKSINDPFDWMFLMQHYGVPTRLLDWSESPLVALYFAVEDMSESDSALWALRPSELNKNAGINDEDEEFFIPSFDDDELVSYTADSVKRNPRNKLKPIASIATRNNDRIQAQHGVFTIHHNEKVGIESVGDGSHATKYVIPAERKKVLIRQLELLGFTRFQLFPELESVGYVIKQGLV